jgi:hypothetical protein
MEIHFISSGWIPRSEMAGLCIKSTFRFVKKNKKSCQIVFQSECGILLSHKQIMIAPSAPNAQQHLMLSVFWILAILISA